MAMGGVLVATYRSVLGVFLRRVVFWLVVLVLLVWLTFFGLTLARGTAWPQAAERAVRVTVEYLPRLLRGDLGTAYAAAYGQRRTEVITVLRQVFPRSMVLLLAGLGLAALAGIPLGAWAASRRRAGALTFSLLGLSLPTFFLALVLQLGMIALTQHTGRPWLPVGGFGWDSHLVLPMVVLAVQPLARIARMIYVTVRDTLEADFVRTARAKGIAAHWLWGLHIGKAVMPTVLTTMVVSLRYALSALPVVELYFGWPGLGYSLMRAIARQDDYLSVALVLGLGLALFITDTAASLLVRWLDPRTVQEATGARPQERLSWQERLAAWWLALRDLMPRAPQPMPPLRSESLPRSGQPDESDLRAYRRRTVWKALRHSPMIWIGGMLTLLLLGLYFFGPSLATHNPYATQGLVVENGQLSSPPYPPSPRYLLGTDVLGRDLFSLLVTGARQTLTLVFWAVAARLLIGAFLGLLAALLVDSLLDRALSGLAQVISSFPALIVAMLLILGLGVRQGMWVFVVGLSVVGWGEVFQFVRTEALRLLRRPFVESGIAVGNSELGLSVRYLLPNLLPHLLALTSLEAAAVLLLIGDLGFVGVFLGGGAFAEVFIGSPPYHYSDVPEWASLLSNVRLYARSYPWTAIYPALAFFSAVLAFNLLGEGLRELLPRIGFSVNRLVNRWSVGLVVLLGGLAWWTGGHVGALDTYRAYARHFDVHQAISWTQAIASRPRGIEMPEQEATAQWLADQLEALGLLPAGEAHTYFATVKRDYFEITQVPRFEGAGETWVYRQDFSEVPSLLWNAGQGCGELVVLGMGELTVQEQRYGGLPYAPALADLDLHDKVVLLLHPVPPHLLPYLPRQGTLVVAPDAGVVHQRTTLSAYSPWGREEPMPGAPWFYLTPEAADRLLRHAGLSLQRLQHEEATLGPDEVRLWRTGVEVSGEIVGEVHRKVPVWHVLAYWPGSDETLDERLIVVLAPYDGLRPDVLGVRVPGAVNHASAVGVLLEALRTLKAQEFTPRRTLYIALYASQGYDFGKTPRVTPDIGGFLAAKAGFGLLTPEAVVSLYGLGGGSGNRLLVGGSGSLHLTEVAERAARLNGVPVRRELAPLNLGVVFDANAAGGGSEAPWITLSWEGSADLLGHPEDDVTALRPEVMGPVGKTLTLLLTLLSHAPSY